jgi:hypothetical protein
MLQPLDADDKDEFAARTSEVYGTLYVTRHSSSKQILDFEAAAAAMNILPP